MNHLEQPTVKQVVARNVAAYIEAIGKTKTWVAERSGMTRRTLHKQLKGEGEVEKKIEKLNRLFRIADPMYFYASDFTAPPSLETMSEAMTLKQQAAASFHASGDPKELDDTLETLEELITMIDVLKNVKEVD